MEQLICIVQISAMQLDAIFHGGLVINRSQTTFKGYQQSFVDYIASTHAINGRTEACGPINVDLSKAAIDQLWEEVKAVMECARLRMMPFLRLFGVEAGNVST